MMGQQSNAPPPPLANEFSANTCSAPSMLSFPMPPLSSLGVTEPLVPPPITTSTMSIGQPYFDSSRNERQGLNTGGM